MKRSERLMGRVIEAEGFLVDLVAILAPWLAPIPSAYLVYRAAVDHLEWFWVIGLVAAIAIEAIGVTSIVNALKLWDWNQVRSAKDGRAPFGLAVVVCVVYVVVTVGLTVLMDVFPDLAFVAPAIFPLLALVGGLNIALRNGQKGREAERSGRLGKRLSKRSGRSDGRSGSVKSVQSARGDGVQKNGGIGAAVNEKGALGGGDGGDRLERADMEVLLLNVLRERPNVSFRFWVRRLDGRRGGRMGR